MTIEPTARSEATDAAHAAADANVVAVDTAAIATSDRALVVLALNRNAAAQEEFAAAVREQVAQSVADNKAAAERAELAAAEAKLAREAEEKRTRRRSIFQALALGIIVIALSVGGLEGHAYIAASNHRSATNSRLLTGINKTNKSIADYTTGPASIKAAQMLHQELLCLEMHTDHDVLGTPVSVACTKLGI